MKVFIKHAFFFSGAVASIWAPVLATSTSPLYRSITLRHIEGGGVGYNKGYTTLSGFFGLGLEEERTIPFLDLRVHIFDDGKWAGNAGIGVRRKMGNRSYGIHGFYDYRNTNRQSYNQASLGLETLGDRIDARINGYLPVGKKTSSPYDTRFYRFSGHRMILSSEYELSMKGIDAEVGVTLGKLISLDFYAAAGPYYYKDSLKGHASGGKARFQAKYKQYVSLEAIDSYDNVFHNRIQGQISFSVPIGKGSCKKEKKRAPSKTLACKMTDPIARNEIVVIRKKTRYPTGIDPITGDPYYFVFVDNTSSSSGTYESPYHSLIQAQDNSAPGQIVYVFPGDGTTKNMDRGIVLQADQKLWGSAIPYALPTTLGSVTIPAMSSSAPQITNITELGVGVTLSKGNEIGGITLTETSGHAVSGENPITINISSCTFSACGQGSLGIFPVLLQTDSPLILAMENNTFLNNPNGGVFVQLLPGVSSARVTMNGNHAFDNQATSGGAAILNIEGHGAIGNCILVTTNNIYQNNACGAVNISDLDSPQAGSFTSFQGTFTNNTFASNAQGIIFATNADDCSLMIQDCDLSDNTQGSILVSAGNSGTQIIDNLDVVVHSCQINQGGTGGDAVTINPAGHTLSVTLTNNSISNNLGSGFVSFFNQPGPDATLLIADNVIANNQNSVNFNASGGISFDGFASVAATIENNTFANNAQGNSIGSYGGSFPSSPGTSSVVLEKNIFSENDTFNFEFYGNPPATGCFTVSGNTSTTDPTYIFGQNGTGSCFLVPCNYETENTGGFSLSGAIPGTDCSGGSCP